MSKALSSASGFLSSPKTTSKKPAACGLSCAHLTPDAFRLLLGRRYNRAKKRAQRARRPKDSVRLNSDEATRTDAELAKLAGVGKDTIRKVEKITQTAAHRLLDVGLIGQTDALA